MLRPAEGQLFAAAAFAAAWDSFVLPAMGLPPGPAATPPTAGGTAAAAASGGGVSGMLAFLSPSEPTVIV